MPVYNREKHNSRKIVDMQLECEEKDDCEENCKLSRGQPEIQKCYSCYSTDLCNSSANSIVHSIVATAVVGIIGMYLVWLNQGTWKNFDVLKDTWKVELHFYFNTLQNSSTNKHIAVFSFQIHKRFKKWYACLSSSIFIFSEVTWSSRILLPLTLY